MKEYDIKPHGDFLDEKYDLFEIENNKTKLLLENKPYKEIEKQIKIELSKKKVKALNLLAKDLKSNFFIKAETSTHRYYDIWEEKTEKHLEHKLTVFTEREDIENEFAKYLLPFVEENAGLKLKNLEEEKEKLENRIYEIDNEIYDYEKHLEKKVKALISVYKKEK